MQYKKIIVWLTLITALIVGANDLFHAKPDAIRAMIAVYFCIPLASLTLTPIIKSRALIIGGIIAGTLFLLSRGSVLSLLSVAVFVGGTIYTIVQHNNRLFARKNMNMWALSYVHSGLFAMVCAIAGTFSIMSKPDTFAITCDQVRTTINQHLATVLMPLRFTQEQINDIQSGFDSFFTKTPEAIVQDHIMGQISNTTILSDSVTNTITNALPTTLKQQLDPSALQDMEKMVTSMLQQNNHSATNIENIQVPSNLTIQEKLRAREILKAATNAKTIPTLTIGEGGQKIAQGSSIVESNQQSTSIKVPGDITQPLQDKQDIDQKVCEVIFTQLREWSQKPEFKISMIITLIFFFYPLGRLIAYVYSIILAILYTILRQTGFISVIPEEKIVDTWLIGDGYEGQTLLSRMAFLQKDTPSAKKERFEKIIAAKDAAVSATHPAAQQTSSLGSTTHGLAVDEIIGDISLEGPVASETDGSGDIVSNTIPSQGDTLHIQQKTKTNNEQSGIDFGSFGGSFGQKFKS